MSKLIGSRAYFVFVMAGEEVKTPTQAVEAPQAKPEDKLEELREKVRCWLKRVRGCQSIREVGLVKGLSGGHRVDFWAVKDDSWGHKEYLVKCIITEGEKKHVRLLKRTWDDIEAAFTSYVGNLRPNIVNLVSSEGFTKDALKLADRSGIQCYASTERGLKRMIRFRRPSEETEPCLECPE